MFILIVLWCIIGIIISFTYIYDNTTNDREYLLGPRVFLSLVTCPFWPIVLFITFIIESPDNLNVINPFYYLGLGLLKIEDKIKGRK